MTARGNSLGSVVAAPPGGAATAAVSAVAGNGLAESASVAPADGLVVRARDGVEVWLEQASLGYPTRDGFAVVLEAVDLHLAPGERLAVVGPSGCGKSTLLHALAGLLEPVRGRVRVTSATADTPGETSARGRAAYMFQNDLLLPWKPVWANAAFAAELALPSGRRWSYRRASRGAREAVRERALVLLREFGLEDALHLYPHQLSGGMRQRVALARTLALGRGLVLLDEPFGGLDALTRADLREWMACVMETHAATWVLVTHDVDEAVQLADRVVVLGGRPAVVRGSVHVGPAGGPRAGADVRLTPAGLRRAAAEVRRLLARDHDR